MGYSHPDHGEMERYEYGGWQDVDIDGWRCEDCHVVAEESEADEVFDEYDCEEYEKVRKGITDSL